MSDENAPRMRPARQSFGRGASGQIVVRTRPAERIRRNLRRRDTYFDTPIGLTLNDVYTIFTLRYHAMGENFMLEERQVDPRFHAKYLGKHRLHWSFGVVSDHYVYRFLDLFTNQIIHIFYEWPQHLLHRVASLIRKGLGPLMENNAGVHIWVDGHQRRHVMDNLSASKLNAHASKLDAHYLY